MNSEWISVRTELPPEMTAELWRESEDKGKVLFDNLLGVFVGFLYQGTWYTGNLKDAIEGNGEWVDDVKFWMHIPKRKTVNDIPPPKEDWFDYVLQN